MCECGCSGYDQVWRLPAPNRQTYLIGTYRACRDCDHPAGLDIRVVAKGSFYEEQAKYGEMLPMSVDDDGDKTAFFSCGKSLGDLKNVVEQYFLTYQQEDEEPFDEIAAGIMVEELEEDLVPKIELVPTESTV